LPGCQYLLLCRASIKAASILSMAYAIPARILLSMLLLFESAFSPPKVMYTRSKVTASLMPPPPAHSPPSKARSSTQDGHKSYPQTLHHPAQDRTADAATPYHPAPH